jgi:DNA invertase Pin-like site-specific DNA recombinase
MQAAIGYLRVSTKEQGRSGLGLAAQRHEIEQFGSREGFSLKSWHQDVQTGAGADALIRRPGLAAALKEAQAKCCPLIVSKLDRLSRNVHFISGLMEHRVHFVVAQLGRDRDDFTLHIWACLAQHERTMRAELCKKALAAAKARGVKLGQAARSKQHQRRVSAIAAVATQKAAMQRAETFRPHIDWVLLQPGAKGRPITYQAAADKLNERNISAPNGGRWEWEHVRHLARRLGLRERVRRGKRLQRNPRLRPWATA